MTGKNRPDVYYLLWEGTRFKELLHRKSGNDAQENPLTRRRNPFLTGFLTPCALPALSAENWDNIGMTVDERIERLTERTQAIAESLELVVIQVRELGHSIGMDAENIRALARIAEIHEHRLTHLEGGNPA